MMSENNMAQSLDAIAERVKNNCDQLDKIEKKTEENTVKITTAINTEIQALKIYLENTYGKRLDENESDMANIQTDVRRLERRHEQIMFVWQILMGSVAVFLTVSQVLRILNVI